MLTNVAESSSPESCLTALCSLLYLFSGMAFPLYVSCPSSGMIWQPAGKVSQVEHQQGGLDCRTRVQEGIGACHMHTPAWRSRYVNHTQAVEGQQAPSQSCY